MTAVSLPPGPGRRQRPLVDLAHPAPGGYRASTDGELLRHQVVTALRAMLDQAETRSLEATTTDNGMTIMIEHGPVRCVLVVSAQEPRHTLSPRELQIARLVAAGDTNRAIASTLDISLWTVSTHMRRIFAKLGVGSRAEMVAQFFGAAERS